MVALKAMQFEDDGSHYRTIITHYKDIASACKAVLYLRDVYTSVQISFDTYEFLDLSISELKYVENEGLCRKGIICVEQAN